MRTSYHCIQPLEECKESIEKQCFGPEFNRVMIVSS
jgi:hypothetical protein